ncbi:MAG TPA: DUF433 domain-containing protein [Chloroflexota bacterium]
MDEAALISRYIELDPRHPWPGDAHLRDSGVPVWAIIGHWRDATDGDAAAVARDYDLPLQAVQAALAYYQEHQAAITARLEENAAMVPF